MNYFLIIFICIISFNASSEVYTKKDLTFGTRTEQEYVKVFKDLTYERTLKYKVEKVDSVFLKSLRTLEYSFDKNYDKVEFQKVEVCRKGKCKAYDTSKSIVKDKYEANGNSNKAILRYVIDDLRVGDELSYIVKRNGSFKDIGFYYKNFLIGKAFQKNTELIIDSEIDLYFDLKLKDNIKIIKNTPKKIHLKQVKDVKKINLSLDENVVLINEYLIDLKVSSLKYWRDYEKMNIDYFKYQDVDLPKDLLDKIKNKDELEKARLTIGYLSHHFTYYGVWNRSRGGIKPRSYNSIMKSKYGDCKDLTYVLYLWLKKMNLDANIAFIDTKGTRDNSKSDVVYESFDHVIVYLNIKGKDYWLNPVEELPVFPLVHSSLQQRRAYVLNVGFKEVYGKYSELNDVLVISKYKNSKFVTTLVRSSIDEDDSLEQKIYSGYSDKKINKTLIYDLQSRFKTTNSKIEKLKYSRESKTLSPIAYTYFGESKEIYLQKTVDSQYIYNIDIPFENRLKVATKMILEDDQAEVVIKLDKLLNHKDTIYIVSNKNHDDYRCRVKSEWLELEIIVTKDKEKVLVHKYLDVKKMAIILNNENSKQAFLDFYIEYRKCAEKTAVVI